MNVLNVIEQFEKLNPCLEKDNFHGVFSAVYVVMDYYSQKREFIITSKDEAIDALYAIYAYELIHEMHHTQTYCDYKTLSEYSTILNKYLGTNKYQDIIMAIQRFEMTSSLNKKSIQ